MDFEIRNEEAGDIEQVRTILRAAFPSKAESELVDALRANGKAIVSLVAVSGAQVLGHIMFSAITTTPPNDAKGIGLAPVAVRPDVQSQGIGTEVIKEGLRRCQELTYDYCVVLGNPKYYQRFRFEKASSFGLENEYGVDEEFMVIRFSKSGIQPEMARGLVRYAAEFGLFSV